MRSRLSTTRRIGQYLSLAQRLGRGLRSTSGLGLRILTNDPDCLREKVERRSRREPGFEPSFDIEELKCDGELPATSDFFAASHKIYAFRHFAASERYNILLDLDVLCTGQFNERCARWIQEGRALVYDISGEAFASSGRDRVAADLAQLYGRPVKERWYGGEFIAGEAKFFGELFAELRPVLDRYRTLHRKLSHQGDEILVSAVLSGSEELGVQVMALPIGMVIQRLWLIQNDRTRQKLMYPVPALLHLPAMKALLDSPLNDRQLLWLVSLLDRLPGRLAKKLIRFGGVLLGRNGRGWD